MRHLAFLALLLAACNTLPVGFDQLGRVPETREFTLAPDSMVSYGRYAPLGASDELVLGRDNDFQTRCLVRIPLPETLTLDSVIAVQLVLRLPDTMRTDTFGIVCRPCSTEWEEVSASWSMARPEDQWLARGGDFLDTVIGRAEATQDSVVIEFQYAGLDSAMRGRVRENGLFLFPATADDTGFVAFRSGEAATGERPRVRVIYRPDSTSRYFEVSEDATLCDTIPGSTRSYELNVGSGFVFRTWLRFRLDSIPREATVARAELRFRPTTQYRRSDSLPLAVQRLTEPVTNLGMNPRLAAATMSAAYVVPADRDTAVRLDVTTLVQFWTANRDSSGRDTANFGLAVAPENNWDRFFRLRIARAGADACSLQVRYVMPPEDRFTRTDSF
jgi:hypothetical protein